MSEVRLNVLDSRRTLAGTVHGSEADAAVAALSAEPETIKELQDAVAQFIKPVRGCRFFQFFETGTNAKPWDAGIVFIDLAARVVAAESSYSRPAQRGQIHYHDGNHATDVSLPFFLPDDWLFTASVDEYRAVREQRRAERAAAPPFDARGILFGAAVLEFIAAECIAAGGTKAKDPIRRIHASWLMTPRDDLRGQSPRDVLLRKREFIDADLQAREAHWSFLRKPAPCLRQDSAAYRFAGFGTHGLVMYYALLRFLLSDCMEHVKKPKSATVANEAARLGKVEANWLRRPQPELGGRAPGFIIECERRRAPLPMTAEEMADDDEDCPLCDMIRGEELGPMFCHFDGYGLDDDFAFSLHTSRADWEAEQAELKRSLEELSRKYGRRGKR